MKKRLLKVVLLFGMGLAQLAGAPITPEQIEELLQHARRSKIEHVLHHEDEDEPTY